ncbi:MAG: sensor histidine kinase [Desulfobacteraceae bacterium]|nr:sensor histidine kinase [Desulfobacteraceae bacterium]
MPLIKKIKPPFWDHYDAAAGQGGGRFSFRRKWKLIVFLTSLIALLPLVSMTLVDSALMQEAADSRARFSTERLVSNALRAVAFYITEKKTMLSFILRDNDYAALNRPERLLSLLSILQTDNGGIEDMGIVNRLGRVTAYSGPNQLMGSDFSGKDCFKQVVLRGSWVSELETNHPSPGKLAVAVKQELSDDDFFVLRAAVDAGPLFILLSQLDMATDDDAFIINADGILQTPSRWYGASLKKVPLPVPMSSDHPAVFEHEDPNGDTIMIGYTYIRDTPFILMVVRKKADLMAPWFALRIKRLGLLGGSVVVVVLAILGMATFLVHRIHVADQKRVMALHQVEYTGKLASIGRLASGVAHEINNPIAVINEKAGLIKDIYQFNQAAASGEKIIGLLEDVSAAVKRCSVITRRLLNFARHVDTRIERVNIQAVLDDVLSFLQPEANRNHITITIESGDDLPEIFSDEGCLQQIFLNLLNNAFTAMADGGRLRIGLQRGNTDTVEIKITDSGCGIPEQDLVRVFEPFFSTKNSTHGTGLGLSITYGLVQEIGGSIGVESRVGEGTGFTITLPMTAPVQATRPVSGHQTSGLT